ncbi:MAG: hypothetical protein P8R42_15575 [Candidatus Binatia bacterium]|nr:hypothetical protein [Candidatus Binatia bacterium]
MRRLINATRFILLAALAAGTMLLAPSAASADTAEADLHHVDPGSGRISSRPIGYLRFSAGKDDKGVDILIQIRNLPNVQSEQPLTTTGGHAVYEHGLRIRATGDCKDMTPTDSQAGVLPDIGILQDGNATVSVTAEGITLSELPGKSVVMYRGNNDAKRQILACGVIKKD